jgi:hypothetical protein
VGEHGRVLSTGRSNAMPPATAGLVLDAEAPPGTYWDGDEFQPMGQQPSPLHRYDWPSHTWIDTCTLDVAKTLQRQLVTLAFEARAAALTAEYPEHERLTWPVQQAEALAFGADPQSATPYLDGLATARGIPAADMRQRALVAVQNFMTASQVLLGTKQGLIDAIDAAGTVEAVKAVVWPAS